MAKRSVPLEGRWLARPVRHSDEMLSSWLYRAATANHCALGSFVEQHCTRRLGWLRDLDRFVPVEVTERVALSLGTTFVDCAQATYYEWDIYLDNLTDKTRSGGNARWYIKANRPKGEKVSPIPMQYCPECLSEAPYFRKQWRMSFVTHCLKHGRLLASACPHCGTRFYYRGTLSAKVTVPSELLLHSCIGCTGDLRSGNESPFIPRAGVFDLQSALLDGLVHGETKLPDRLALTAGVMRLAAEIVELLWVHFSSASYRAMLSSASNIELPSPPASTRRRFFDAASPSDRLSTLSVLAWLLEDVETRYRSFLLRRAKMTPAQVESACVQVGKALGVRT